LNWELVRPAMVKAFVKNGASNSVYRAEDTVSGSTTPTRPLPCDARPVSDDMALKSRVNELMDRLAELEGAEVAGEAAEVAGDVPGLAVVLLLECLLLPQAPAIRPAPNRSAAKARVFFTERRTPWVRGCPPIPASRRRVGNRLHCRL
jgi:hypothetical protein